MKKKRLFIISICFMLVISVSGMGFSYAKSLSDVKNQIDDKKSELEQGQEDQKKVEGEISQLNDKINDLQNDIDSIQSDINATSAKVADVKEKLEQVVREMDQQSDALNKRLRSMYMNENTSFIDVILNSGSISELMTNLELVKRIHKSDKKMLETLQEQHAQIEEKKKELEALKSSLESKQGELKGKQENLEADKSVLNKKRASIKKDNEKIEEEIGALQAEANKLTQQLQNRKPVNQKSYSGGMIWPCSGSVSCEYGYRWCPFHGYELHTGIDIAVSTGTPIVAAASGVVIQAYFNSSYGNMVLLDNGSGICTLYAHNSSLCVSTGQKVSQGQVIAYSGSTGSSTGPHCHFEVRVNGQPTNPRNYL